MEKNANSPEEDSVVILKIGTYTITNTALTFAIFAVLISMPVTWTLLVLFTKRRIRKDPNLEAEKWAQNQLEINSNEETKSIPNNENKIPQSSGISKIQTMESSVSKSPEKIKGVEATQSENCDLEIINHEETVASKEDETMRDEKFELSETKKENDNGDNDKKKQFLLENSSPELDKNSEIDSIPRKIMTVYEEDKTLDSIETSSDNQIVLKDSSPNINNRQNNNEFKNEKDCENENNFENENKEIHIEDRRNSDVSITIDDLPIKGPEKTLPDKNFSESRKGPGPQEMSGESSEKIFDESEQEKTNFRKLKHGPKPSNLIVIF